MNLKQACPDKVKQKGKLTDPASKAYDLIGNVITIKRHNGKIQMKLGAYMRLTKGQRNKLHNLWEEK